MFQRAGLSHPDPGLSELRQKGRGIVAAVKSRDLAETGVTGVLQWYLLLINLSILGSSYSYHFTPALLVSSTVLQLAKISLVSVPLYLLFPLRGMPFPMSWLPACIPVSAEIS